LKRKENQPSAIKNMARVPETELDVGLLVQSSKITEIESQNSLLRNDLDPNEELEEKYAYLMSQNQRLDSFKNENGSKLLKKSTQFKLYYKNNYFLINPIFIEKI